MKLRCLIRGGHDWSPWTVHTTGPCVFESVMHVFRICRRCHKTPSIFAEEKN